MRFIDATRGELTSSAAKIPMRVRERLRRLASVVEELERCLEDDVMISLSLAVADGVRENMGRDNGVLWWV